MASVSSDPAGAAVFLDGKNTSRVTPVQVSIEKPGMHTFVLKKQGYLDESTRANLQAGQRFRFGPALKPLGTTDDIKIGGGEFKKLFGGFFFQAEDGIRDLTVTGVQTCALPI